MCIRQLAFIPAWIRGPEFLISQESLNPVTGGHLRAAGRRQETPKKAVVVGDSHCRSMEMREKRKHRGHVT